MSKVYIHIDGKELIGFKGQLLVDVAAENGIHIPTLCHDERVKAYGACGVCVVEAEHTPKLIRACSTEIFDGMVVTTMSDRVYSTRKAALELLLSDHRGDCRPPCVLACPGQTDCQGYVGLVALGEYHEALKLVKDKIPLPGSIGRVCPHPCEDACRREMVEEPINIAQLKSFLGDKDMENDTLWTPEVAEETGKRVAVIGGGPGGLSTAYFLRAKGHHVEIFDKMPQMGGMLYYGIPEYRLPKDYLTAEVHAIRDMGITFHNNVEIGKDKTLEELQQDFDAVVLATGAWTSTPLRCPGEELEGVVGGIDFLREVVTGQPMYTGKNIAIVGGGNTAMDACRTAIRLGAENVYNIYRRTKAEMPAEEIEIVESEEEGVIFKELTNPLEVLGKDGKVTGVRLQIMELGEPDASGRRSPQPVEGAEETLEIDTIIVAIGQKLDPQGLEDVQLTNWGTIVADETTFATNLDGVFAIGDATNKGADIAIAAIGEARRGAEVINGYLYGDAVAFKEPYYVTQEITPEMVAHHEKADRQIMPHRAPDNRRDNFLEINLGFSDESAQLEGARCLECGCHDFFECKLIATANEYDVHPEKFEGEVHCREVNNEHPFIYRNPDRCILCGLCVRVCSQVIGETALGLVGRGFDTMVTPALELPLGESGCISCGQCVNVCPTGALLETMQADKQIPVAENSVITTCNFCSVGCQQELTYTGDQLLRALPYNQRKEDALLCVKGRFGFGEIHRAERLLEHQRGDGEPLSLRQASIYTGKKLQALQTVYGQNSVGVAIGSRYTNEEAFFIREYARRILGTETVFSFGETQSGIASVLGKDGSTATLKEVEHTNLILLVESDIQQPHLIAGLSVKRGVENGATLIALNRNPNAVACEYADQFYQTQDQLDLLKGILKAVVDAKKPVHLNGYDALVSSLKDVTISEEAQEIADSYLAAKKAIIVFEQSKITYEGAQLLANIALAADKAFAPRSGLVQLKPGANSQGLADLGIKSVDEVDTDALHGLIIFGEHPPANLLPKLDFLAVHDLHKTATGDQADILLASQSYAEVSGTVTNTVGHVSSLRPAVASPVEDRIFDVLSSFAQAMEKELPWKSMVEVAGDWIHEMQHNERNEATLQVVGENDPLYRNHPITNHLAVSVQERTPQV